MALTNTIGTFYQPFKDKANAYTPIAIVRYQTSTSFGGTAATRVPICPTGTALGAGSGIWLTSLNVTTGGSCATCVLSVYFDDAVTFVGPTGGGTMAFNFGPDGLLLGNTATASVELAISAGSTATVYAVATYYKIS